MSLHVNADGLNLRSGPGTDHPVVCALHRGTAVQPLGDETDVGGHVWIRARAAGHVGWVSQRYLASDAAAPQGNTLHVTSAGLNLRSGPGKDYAVLCSLHANAAVSLLGDQATVDGSVWVKGTAAGHTGWVSRKHLG